jgi:sugar lactone lactonase YvrE
MSKAPALLIAVCVCLLAAPALEAQAKPGDLIIGNGSGFVNAVTPGTNTVTTLASIPGSLRGVLVGPDNTNYFVAAGLSVFEVAPGGVVTTLVTQLPMGAGTSWNDLDEDGQLLVGTGWAGAGAVFRVDRTSGAVLATFLPKTFPNAFCLDRDTGEVVVGEISTKTVFRVKRDGTATTVATLPSPIYAMDDHGPSGGILIGTFQHLFHLDSLNTVTTFTPNTGYIKAMAVFGDGTVAIGENRVASILRLDPQGKILGTIYNGPSLNNSCMVVEDEHNLWALNTPTPGARLFLSVRFASHPAMPYVAAASFFSRPGIPVDTRRIPINPDDLFTMSVLLPQIFVNFVGVLDASGRAVPAIDIPKAAALRGLRFYLAAVVIDPRAPSSLAQISQRFGVTIQ